ncbi:MAG TPA: phosphate ABC transporter permease PtsA [Lachnospiraceae bacterium]|jgi:phosphate ABC transporter, permease protein PstA|nr:phosphate ABC transporter permease PtsA [Lachnospiraceae bacterium]
MKSKKDLLSIVLKMLVLVSAALTVGVIVLIIWHIFVNGVPNLSRDLFDWKYNSENVSLLPALINTLIMTLISLLIAVPIGVFAAVFLVEYSSQGSRLVKIIRITAETLSGIPSIVYGLFGLLFFVTALKWGMSLLAGSCTVALMILPLIMRTTEEALLAVPKTFREGSFGLGAGRLRTVFCIVLPSALPGIMAGIILATGRIAGETAALMYTAGTVAQVPVGKDFLFDSTRTLAVHMYSLSSEGLYVDKAYATAFVLLVMVMCINTLSSFMAKKFGGNNTNG